MLRAADALGMERFDLGAHDIGGGVAQHLVVHGDDRVRRLVLMSSVVLDPWPVPAVARFADPEVRAAATVGSTLEGRRRSMSAAVGRAPGPDEVEDDDVQKVELARRYVEQVPGSDLVEVAGKHIPTEDSPQEVADAMLGHLGA